MLHTLLAAGVRPLIYRNRFRSWDCLVVFCSLLPPVARGGRRKLETYLESGVLSKSDQNTYVHVPDRVMLYDDV